MTLLGDGEGEVGVRFTNASLRAVDRRVDLKTDIEELTRKEISPKVRVENTSSACLHRVFCIIEDGIHTGLEGTRNPGQDSHPDAGESAQLRGRPQLRPKGGTTEPAL